ncbi:hypothetical protein BDV12DRAFT_126335 [Aspergillus spectabilis]
MVASCGMAFWALLRLPACGVDEPSLPGNIMIRAHPLHFKAQNRDLLATSDRGTCLLIQREIKAPITERVLISSLSEAIRGSQSTADDWIGAQLLVGIVDQSVGRGGGEGGR